MKKLLLMVFVAGFTLSLFAQPAEIPAGTKTAFLEVQGSEDYSYLDFFGGGTAEVVNNPVTGGDYSAARVLKLTKGAGQPWPGTQTHTGGHFVYTDNDSVWTLWYMATYAQQVMLTNQNFPDWFTRSIAFADYTTPGEWQKLVFTFDTTGTNGGGVPTMNDHFMTWSITPFNGVTIAEDADSLTYYIDSLTTTVGWKPIATNTVDLSVTDLASAGGAFTAKLLPDGSDIALTAAGNVHTGELSITPYYWTDNQNNTSAFEVEYSRDGSILDTVAVTPWAQNPDRHLEAPYVYVSTTNPETDIYLTDAPPTIDGDASDAIWSGLIPNYMVQFPGGSAGPVEAYWKAAWDFDNIYIGVTVMDANLHSGNATCYLSDNQELYFSMTQSDGDYTDGDWQIRLNYDSDILSTGGACTDITGDFPTSEFAQTHSGGTSFYEWKIAWSELHANFAVTLGSQFGFDVAYGDDPDGDGRQFINSWNYPTDVAYQNTSVFGTLTLQAEPTSVETNMLSEVEVKPNPANEMLYITGTSNVSEITMYNIIGAKVHTITDVDAEINSVNVSNLHNGIYFVSIKAQNGAERTIKILVN